MSKGTALVTGASSGIGAALARRFASMDFDLVVTARREALLSELAAELRGSIDVHVFPADLASPEGPAQLIDAVASQGIDVDILVNNAGIAHTQPFHQLSEKDVADLLAVNITALTSLTHHFIPLMIARGSGRILNVASVAAFQPVPAMSLYAASKAFVLSLTESLSEELRGTGVSATALCPGFTRTDMMLSFDDFELPPFIMATAAEVASEGYDALMSREVIRIPGLANRAAVLWTRYHPRWLVRGLGGLAARLRRGDRQRTSG